MYNVLIYKDKICWTRDVHGKIECEYYARALREKGYTVKITYSPDFAEGDYDYWDIEPVEWLKWSPMNEKWTLYSDEIV